MFEWVLNMLLMNDYPFKRQPYKMVKHTQTIRRLVLTNCLSVFDHFVGLTLKGLFPAETWEAAGIGKLACEAIPYGIEQILR